MERWPTPPSTPRRSHLCDNEGSLSHCGALLDREYDRAEESRSARLIHADLPNVLPMVQ
jgi:hypothetical protein